MKKNIFIFTIIASNAIFYGSVTELSRVNDALASISERLSNLEFKHSEFVNETIDQMLDEFVVEFAFQKQSISEGLVNFESERSELKKTIDQIRNELVVEFTFQKRSISEGLVNFESERSELKKTIDQIRNDLTELQAKINENKAFQSKVDALILRRLLQTTGVLTAVGTAVYAARTEKGKNWKNTTCAFAAGLIPNYFKKTPILPTTTEASSTSPS